MEFPALIDRGYPTGKPPICSPRSKRESITLHHDDFG
jgi:hypothetical protein